MKIFKEHGAFIVLFSLCALLRFIPLFDYQFTFDELSGLDRTQFNSFSEVMEKGVKVDAHPALVQLIIYYLSRFFGYETWIIKLPFLLFSLCAVLYAYLFGQRNFSKQSALFAVLLFSFSLIFVFYAPIARMYISGVFFSLGLLYHFFEIVFHKEPKLKQYILFGLFALLGALNQHLNALFALTVAMSGVFFLNRENRKSYLITCALVVLCYMPHLPVTLYQFSIPGIGRDAGGWLEVPDFAVLFKFVAVLFGTGKMYILFLTLVLTAFVLKRKFSFSKQQALLLVLFLLNFLVIYFYSVLRSPIYQHSVMLFSATALVLFVCSFLEFQNGRVFYSAFILLFLSLVYTSYFKKDYLNEAVKTVYEYQFERTDHYKNKFGEKEVYPLFFDCDTLMQKIYFKKYKRRFACKISSDSIISYSERMYFKRTVTGAQQDTLISSIKLFSEFVSQLNCTYVAISSAMPLYQCIVSEYFPYLIENTQTQGINFKLYSNRVEDKSLVVADDAVLCTSSFRSPEQFAYSKGAEGFPLLVDSVHEFPFEVRAPYRDVVQKEGEFIIVKTKLKLYGTETNQLECVISARNKTTGEPYSYNSRAAGDFLKSGDSTLVLYSDAFVGSSFYRIKKDSELAAYFWNRGKEKFKILEFEIKMIDYWPNKWHYWD